MKKYEPFLGDKHDTPLLLSPYVMARFIVSLSPRKIQQL